MNYISEHYSVVMAVLLIGDVIVVSMTIWIIKQKRAGRFYKRKTGYDAVRGYWTICWNGSLGKSRNDRKRPKRRTFCKKRNSSTRSSSFPTLIEAKKKHAIYPWTPRHTFKLAEYLLEQERHAKRAFSLGTLEALCKRPCYEVP